MAVTPDMFAQGSGIQERLAAALQDPAMRERLLSQMPQIVQQLQAQGGPIGERLGAVGGGAMDRMPPALQAEMLRGRLASPGGGMQPGAPPFLPPGAELPGGVGPSAPIEAAPGGGLAGSPIPEAGIQPVGEPVPLDPGGIAMPSPGVPPGSEPFLPREEAFADLRNQYGNAEQMADRRQKLQSELDEGREQRSDRRGTRPQPTNPDEGRKAGGGPKSAPVRGPGFSTAKKRLDERFASRGGAYVPVGMR